MRAIWLVLASLGLVCVVAACGGGGGSKDKSASCEPVQTVSGLPFNHVTTDPNAISYSSNPPAGGNHTGNRTLRGNTEPENASEDAAPETAPLGIAVHSLEHGAVIAWTNKLSKDQVKNVRETMRSLAASDDANPGSKYSELHIVENPKLDVPFALSAWGQVQKCKGPNESAIKSFVEKYYGQGPEGTSIGCRNTQAPSCERLRAISKQYDAAVQGLNAGRRTFVARLLPDARAGNLDAVKADAAQFRTAVYNFDVNGVRKITFPEYLRPEVNALLERLRTVVGDLDAFGSSRTGAEAARLYSRYTSDYSNMIRAANKLVNAL